MCHGTTIEKGAATVISAILNSGTHISAVKLTDTKVFIAHSRSDSPWLYGIVCTISGTTITTGTDTQIGNSANTGSVISAVKLSDSKVFIAHSGGSTSSYYLYGIVCTISETKITKAKDTSLITSYSASTISAVALSEDKVFIAHKLNTDTFLHRNGMYNIRNNNNKRN